MRWMDIINVVLNVIRTLYPILKDIKKAACDAADRKRKTRRG